ncbi:hypothetical protein [Deinococcus sp. Marseille-Q6407]|uniref:hypothetical protein n=1 Tax=Deinococcus sp. Marseille-Q6407 TaxID=2969223 RepID=UPI0021BDF165|nr:hypothetical protein [Deinococcus sp. Marseille-Q6407]
MTKAALAFLTVPALAACSLVTLPPQPLPDVTLTTPLPLVASGLRLFQEAPLFPAPVDGRLKNISVTGQATLSVPASSRVVVDVLLTRDLPVNCLSYGGYRGCLAGGETVGTVTFEAGQTGASVLLRGASLTELAHAAQGHLGLMLKEGSLPANTTVQLTGLRAAATL